MCINVLRFEINGMFDYIDFLNWLENNGFSDINKNINLGGEGRNSYG